MRLLKRTISLLLLGGLLLLSQKLGIDWQALLSQADAPRQPATSLPLSGVLTGRITRLADGDSFEVRTDNGQRLEVRLWGIDAPEGRQAGGREARAALQRLTKRYPVLLAPVEYDQYGRLLANAYCHDLWLNHAMLTNGWAWHYVHFSDNPELAAAESEARRAKRGLWQAQEPQPPWEWRRQNCSAGRN